MKQSQVGQQILKVIATQREILLLRTTAPRVGRAIDQIIYGLILLHPLGGFVHRPMSSRLLVSPQSRQLRISKMTHFALVRFLSSVEAHVVPKCRGLRESFLAILALKRLLQRVYTHVRAKVAPWIETSSTQRTLEATRNDGLFLLLAHFIHVYIQVFQFWNDERK